MSKTHRLLVALAGAVALLAVPGSATAAIVASKCEDAGCRQSHIWTIDPVSGAQRPVTADPRYRDDDPAVAPGGRRVAFQRCPAAGGACHIALVGVAGGAVTNLTPGRDYEDWPAFSPDGDRLVFARTGPAGDSDLVVLDLATRAERELTSGVASDDEPAWSPHGATIAFTRREAGAESRIFGVSASGGAPVPLTAGHGESFPAFSPDGSKIAFEGGDAIQVMDRSGANARALTAPPAGVFDSQPAFSPDGTRLVFERSSLAPRVSPLLAIAADGSGEHLLSGAAARLLRPAWHARPRGHATRKQLRTRP